MSVWWFAWGSSSLCSVRRGWYKWLGRSRPDFRSVGSGSLQVRNLGVAAHRQRGASCRRCSDTPSAVFCRLLSSVLPVPPAHCPVRARSLTAPAPLRVSAADPGGRRGVAAVAPLHAQLRRGPAATGVRHGRRHLPVTVPPGPGRLPRRRRPAPAHRQMRHKHRSAARAACLVAVVARGALGGPARCVGETVGIGGARDLRDMAGKAWGPANRHFTIRKFVGVSC